MITLLLGAGFSLLISLLLTPLIVRVLRGLRLGQLVRSDTPEQHQLKRGTPSMGGVAIVLSSIAGYFLALLITNERVSPSVLLAMFMMVGLGLVGFIDDFLKVRRQNSIGLRPVFKFLGQLMVATPFALMALTIEDANGVSAASTAVSFARDLDFDFVALFGVGAGLVLAVIWINIITAATSHAVNLTDGLDGLATGASIFTIGAYVIIGVWQTQQNCFGRLLPETFDKCYIVANPFDLATFAAAVVGALIGFLWWNTTPAKIFMGDSGAFALGGVIAALAILSRTELLLLLLGGLFMIVTLSVIVQIGVWRGSKRRIRLFKASPLHHHFEMLGWAEITIVVRFWIISGLFVAAGVGLFYTEWLR